MHIHGAQLGGVVGGVVIHPGVGIAAAGIQRQLARAVLQHAAAPLLCRRAQNVQELADALGLAVAGTAVQPGKGRPYKAGGGGQVAGQTHGAHAPAVCLQRQGGGEAVFRRLGGQLGVVVQPEQLHGEGRLVGQHARRVLIDPQALRRLLYREALLPVRQQPVQPGRGQPRQKGVVGDAALRQQVPGLRRRGAAAQQPGDQLELGHVGLSRRAGAVYSAADEVQPRHAQALLVHRVIVQGVAVLYGGHADHGVVPRQVRQMPHGQGKEPGCDDHLLAEAALIVQIAPEIEAFCFVCGRSAHGPGPPFIRYPPARRGTAASGRRENTGRRCWPAAVSSP